MDGYGMHYSHPFCLLHGFLQLTGAPSDETHIISKNAQLKTKVLHDVSVLTKGNFGVDTNTSNKAKEHIIPNINNNKEEQMKHLGYDMSMCMSIVR